MLGQGELGPGRQGARGQRRAFSRFGEDGNGSAAAAVAAAAALDL